MKKIIKKIIKEFCTNSTFVKNIIMLAMLGRLYYLEDDGVIKLFESLIVLAAVFGDSKEIEDKA